MTNLPAVSDLTREYSVSELKAQYILTSYLEVFRPQDFRNLQEYAADIEVTDESQQGEMERARDLRLEMRKIRLAVEQRRKDLKEDALREGKAIDAIGRLIRESSESIEEHLKAQEEYAKRQQEKRERERREKAEALLREQEERERQEAEAKRAAEQEAMRKENERLKAEAAEREKQIAEERARELEARRAEQAKIEEERRQERERHEAELKAERERVEQLAAMVVCPNCGHPFDSREHRQEAT